MLLTCVIIKQNNCNNNLESDWVKEEELIKVYFSSSQEIVKFTCPFIPVFHFKCHFRWLLSLVKYSSK